MFSSEFFSLKRDQLIYSSKQNIIDSYDIYPIKIGEGNDAVIYRAREHQSWGKDRAIKKIHKSYVDNTAYLKNQIEVLKKLDHPGVIKLYQIFQDEQYYFIVTELCQGEDMLKLLRKKGSFSQNQARPLFKKLIQIISYCHINKVMHRDIKLQNLVFSTKETTANSIKLIDFGMSFCWKLNVHKQIQQTFQTNKIVGTIYYLAPQIFNEVYGPQVDIWSAGVVLHFLVTGTLPFWSDYSDQILIQNIKNRKYNLQGFDLSEQIKDLFNRIFQLQNKRITLRQILHHPWFLPDQQEESLNKLTSEKLHYFSLLPYKQTKKYQQILEYYKLKLYPNLKLTNQKEGYNFSFLRWQRIHQFLISSKTNQAIMIFLTNRLNSKKMQKYQIIFNQFKSPIKENISLKTLKQFLNFEYQYLKNQHFHQNNHLNHNNHLSQNQQIISQEDESQGFNYAKKEKICKDLLKYFAQNQNQMIGYTHFISWIVDPLEFNIVEINFIADQLQKSYKILEKYSVNMIIREIQSALRIKLKQDQRKTRSDGYNHIDSKSNNSILLKNILPHPSKGFINHQNNQMQNKYLKVKSLNKAKGRNSVKHSILSSISPSFKKRKQIKPAVLNKILQKQKQKEEGFMVLGKIKRIIMQIPFF